MAALIGWLVNSLKPLIRVDTINICTYICTYEYVCAIVCPVTVAEALKQMLVKRTAVESGFCGFPSVQAQNCCIRIDMEIGCNTYPYTYIYAHIYKHTNCYICTNYYYYILFKKKKRVTKIANVNNIFALYGHYAFNIVVRNSNFLFFWFYFILFSSLNVNTV